MRTIHPPSKHRPEHSQPIWLFGRGVDRWVAIKHPYGVIFVVNTAVLTVALSEKSVVSASLSLLHEHTKNARFLLFLCYSCTTVNVTFWKFANYSTVLQTVLVDLLPPSIWFFSNNFFLARSHAARFWFLILFRWSLNESPIHHDPQNKPKNDRAEEAKPSKTWWLFDPKISVLPMHVEYDARENSWTRTVQNMHTFNLVYFVHFCFQVST